MQEVKKVEGRKTNAKKWKQKKTGKQIKDPRHKKKIKIEKTEQGINKNKKTIEKCNWKKSKIRIHPEKKNLD